MRVGFMMNSYTQTRRGKSKCEPDILIYFKWHLPRDWKPTGKSHTLFKPNVFLRGNMDRVDACSKIMFWKRRQSYVTSQGINCLKLLCHFLTSIHWKLKFCSSRHIVEPNWPKLRRYLSQAVEYFGEMTSLSQDPTTVTEKHTAMLGFLG